MPKKTYRRDNPNVELVPSEISVVIKTQQNIIKDQTLRIQKLKDLVSKQATELRRLSNA